MIDLELPDTPSAVVDNPIIKRLKTAMLLFEIAQSMKDEEMLDEGIPTGWQDVQGWIDSNGWQIPERIPLDTLDKFNDRLRHRLELVDQRWMEHK